MPAHCAHVLNLLKLALLPYWSQTMQRYLLSTLVIWLSMKDLIWSKLQVNLIKCLCKTEFR